jgi:type VI secretion system VasD/TssJ family lipoprotein
MSALRAVLITACLVSLCGCKLFGSDEPQPLEFCSIQLKAMPDLNPNDRGEPTPVDVRIYALKTPNAFTQASFEELWVKEDEALGASMAQKPELITLEPADEEAKGIFKKVKMYGGFYLGIMALYSGQSDGGLEERKICVDAKVADGGRFEFTGHRIVLVGGGAIANADGGGEDGDGEDGDGEDGDGEDGDGDGEDGDGDGDGDGEDGDGEDGDGDGDGEDGDSDSEDESE